MWAFALRNLFSRPVRSLLALLGLTVAIMGMVGLFSVAAGMQATIEKTFHRIPGLAAMQPGTPIPLFSKIPEAWADEIAEMPGVERVCKEVWARANLVEGRTTFNPPRFLFGADVQALSQLKTAVYRDDMVTGRFLQPEDIGQPMCVISVPVAREYGKQVGDSLRVDGQDLQIIGLYETDSLLLNVAIITSRPVAQQIARFNDGVLSSIYIEPDGTIPNDDLAATVRQRFQGRTAQLPTASTAVDALTNLAMALSGGGLPSPSPGSEAIVPTEAGLDVRSAQELGKEIRNFSADLDLFLVLMNSIGVVIALLSILNTMLMSVTERLTEFGVLRANGWSSWNVMHLVLSESAILGVCGGISGCLLGYAGTLVMNAQFPDKLNLYASPAVLLISLAFSTCLGTLGGLYPAWWSIRRSPMEAIRRG